MSKLELIENNKSQIFRKMHDEVYGRADVSFRNDWIETLAILSIMQIMTLNYTFSININHDIIIQ